MQVTGESSAKSYNKIMINIMMLVLQVLTHWTWFSEWCTEKLGPMYELKIINQTQVPDL